MRFRIILLLSALCVVLVTALTWHLVKETQLQKLGDRADASLSLKEGGLRAEIERFRYLPFVLGQDERIKRLLENPHNQALTDIANTYLEAVDESSGSLEVFILNADGLGVASSNWRDGEKSFVGKHYDFRPYYSDAISQGEGHHYAIGSTTGVPGYFLAQRFESDGGATGIAVVKVDMAALEKTWRLAGEHFAVADHTGMIFLAGSDDWKYRPLYPISLPDREWILAGKLYKSESVDQPPLLQSEADLENDQYVQLQGSTAPIRLKTIAGYGWKILAPYDVGPVDWTANLMAALVFLCAALLFVIAFYLIERRQRFRADELREILENVNAGVAVFDGDLRLLSWNNKYLELNSYPESLVRPGRLLSDIIKYNIARGDFGPGDPKALLQERLDRVRRHAVRKTEVRRPDGTWVEIVRSRVPNGTLITTYTDVTERKVQAERLDAQVKERTAELRRTIEEMEIAKGIAEQASRAKTTFMNSISHDIRNPLNAILGYAGLVLSNTKDALPVKQYQNLQKLAAKGRELSEMVNDFLDYSRADHVTTSEFALAPSIDDCLETVEPMIDSRRVELICDLPGDLPILNQDQRKLGRIVSNLLNNAAKFTESGSIKVVVRCRGDAVDIAVNDTGTGIAKEYLSQIFEEYKRIDSGDGRAREGTGLGLAISRRFAMRMGGDIAVQSTPGKGSNFTLTVPIIHPQAIAAKSNTARGADSALDRPLATDLPAGTAGRRRPTVLIVDDSNENRDFLAQLLEGNYRVLLAEDGKKAIQLAEHDHPDLIFMDLSLPIISGWEATRTIKRNAKVPIIAVTAHVSEQDKEDARAAGCDDVLSKPIDKIAVYEALRRYIGPVAGEMHDERGLDHPHR